MVSLHKLTLVYVSCLTALQPLLPRLCLRYSPSTTLSSGSTALLGRPTFLMGIGKGFATLMTRFVGPPCHSVLSQIHDFALRCTVLRGGWFCRYHSGKQSPRLQSGFPSHPPQGPISRDILVYVPLLCDTSYMTFSTPVSLTTLR